MAKPIKHSRSWRIRWFDENKRRKSESYSNFKDASLALARHQNDADEIKRGLRSPTIPKKTFSELCEYYLKYRSTQKRNPKDDACMIRVHLLPHFGELQLSQIYLHVDSFKTNRSYLNKKTLHNLLTLLISMLNVAHELNWLHKTPKIKKPKIKLLEKDFNYLRNDDEIFHFLSATECEGTAVSALYTTAIYTGLRAGELAGLRWEDINFSQRLITVQGSYNGPTKSGEVRYVPILDVLLGKLIAWKQFATGDLVFPNQVGRMQSKSARIFQEMLHGILDRGHFPNIVKNGKLRRYIVFHDLRHTFASHWVMKGGDIFKLQKILGHKSLEMTMRYAHLAPNAFTTDYGRFGDAPSANQSNVIEFPGRT